MTSYYLSSVVNHKEGGGNPCTAGTSGCTSLGRPYYTCGAAATRNMTQAMTGVDMTEAWFVNKLGIDPVNGLYKTSYIPDLLNNNSTFNSHGSWTAVKPSSVNDYVSNIMTDTYSYHQEVIQNVQTSYYGFWQHHSTEHFDDVYGWDSSTGKVGIAEEWDPLWTWGFSSYGNPHGLHPDVDQTNSFNAVHYSPSGQYVIE